MNRLRDWGNRFETFDWLSVGLITLLVGLALSYWSKFPVHMDTFYHLGVTSGYSRAGGIALHSFWEYAPMGRAQLYPPLLHVFMFALNKTGLSMVSVGRLVSFGAFPLLMVSSWYGMRKLFSGRAAFYTVVLLSSCYLLFWHTAVETAASLVLILTPLIFVAVDRNRKVAAAVLLALALYSHLTLGHLVAFSLLIYAIHRREKFKEILIVLAGAYLLWLPWGIHILANYKSLSFSDPLGGTSAGITVHVLIWTAAIAGFIYCYFKKDKYYLLPSFLLGMIPIAFFYPDRFWNAHVFVPLAMLGAVALSALHGLVKNRITALVRVGAVRKVLVAAVMAVPVAVFLLVDPVYATSNRSRGPGGPMGLQVAYLQAAGLRQQAQQQQGQPPAQPPGGPQGNPGAAGGPGGAGGPQGAGGPGGASGLQSRSTTLLSLINTSGGTGQQSLGGTSVIDSDLVKLAALIKANSSSDQIIYCSDGSLGNLITGLTGRSSTGGMFHEVSPSTGTGQGSSYQNAHLLVLTSRQQNANGNRTATTTNTQTIAGNGGSSQQPGTRQGSAQQGPLGQGGAQQGLDNIDTSNYELVGTVGSYSVYRNTATTAKSTRAGTVIPWFVVFSLLGLALIATGVDWFRPGPDNMPAQEEGLLPDRGDSDGDNPGPDSRDSGLPGPISQKAVRHEGNPPGTSRSEALAIVPCYNEAESVRGVIAELKAFAPFMDILIVDDGSTDETASAARQAGAIVVSHRKNLGIGATVRTGMACALEAGYRFAVQVDGDGQHDPRDIEFLLEPLRSGTADMVVGSRFLGAGEYKPPLARGLGIKLLASVVSLASGRKATDTTSGFRAMNRRALAFLVANYPDDFPETESLVLMDIAGIRWEEAPVSMRGRANGVSSISGLVPAYYMSKVLGCIMVDMLRLKAPRPPIYA